MEDQAKFIQPTYLEDNKARVGALVLSLPDGFEYITQDHIPINDNTATAVLDDYAMVAAPADCYGGLINYKDATLGINISGPMNSGIDEEEWENLEGIMDRFGSSPLIHSLKRVKLGNDHLLGYGKGHECGEGKGPYWVSYFVVIFYSAVQYTANLYFNSKKAEETEYEKAVENFCSHIVVSLENYDERETSIGKIEIMESMFEEGIRTKLRKEAKEAVQKMFPQ